MNEFRKIPYLIALIAFFFALAVEGGSFLGVKPKPPTDAQIRAVYADSDPDTKEAMSAQELIAAVRDSDGAPPGLAIGYMAVFDLMVFVTILLLGLGFLIPGAIYTRVQAFTTLIVSLLTLIGIIILIFVAITLLLIMIGLFMAVPFGTLIYLGIYGFFPKEAAAALLTTSMILKIVAGVCLVLAQQRILENKALVAIVLTSLGCGLIISFLHGFLPRILCSITDAVGAIVVGIICAIWALILLILAIPAVIKALTTKLA